MSDDLVKRLRDRDHVGTPTTERNLIASVADRIEELEKELEYWRGDSAAGWDKCDEYRNKLAKALEALDEAIYMLVPNEKDMENRAGIYRIVTAYEELKGETDE